MFCHKVVKCYQWAMLKGNRVQSGLKTDPLVLLLADLAQGKEASVKQAASVKIEKEVKVERVAQGVKREPASPKVTHGKQSVLAPRAPSEM